MINDNHTVWESKFVEILLDDRLANWTEDEAIVLFDYYNSQWRWDIFDFRNYDETWLKYEKRCEIRAEWNKFNEYEIRYFFCLNDDSSIEYELSTKPVVETVIKVKNVDTYLVKFNLQLQSNIFG